MKLKGKMRELIIVLIVLLCLHSQYVSVGTCMYDYFNWINIMAYDESEPKCTNNFSWMTWLYGIFLLYENVMIPINGHATYSSYTSNYDELVREIDLKRKKTIH